MSAASSSHFVLAEGNPFDKNNEHTIRILDDETHKADLTDLQPSGADLNLKTASDEPRMPCGHKLNARNLIVCIDRTSNQFAEKNTNVIELYNLILKKVVDNQRTWYNSGIGTYARPSWKSLSFYKKVFYHKIDLAIAWDFERTVLGAYRWLSDNYEEDDCIYLFGFSCGAFQVRVLSAMIEKVSLVYKGNEMEIPFAYELYADPKSGGHAVRNVRSHDDTDSQEHPTMADRFKKAFPNENVKVHFVGAWDTVSSIGFICGKSMLPGTVDGMTHMCYFHHALALDERQVKFLPEYAHGGSAKPIDNTRESKGTLPQTKEVWFAGTHSDIGNVENTAMDRSRPPLRWMVFEAGAAGLCTARFERGLLAYEQISIIESLTWSWLFFEICPIKRLTFTQKENGLPETTRRPHLGSGRKIHRGQKIHSSLVRADGSTAENYIPKARPFDDDPSFWEKLRDKKKEHMKDIAGWLELDLYEHSKHAVEKLVTEGDDIALKSLHHTYISGDSREAVYRNVIEALHQELTLKNKYLLLHTTMQILKRSSRNDLDFKLSPLSEIRPLLSDLFCNNTDYWRTAWDFVTLFTHFVKVIQLEERLFASFAISPDGTRIASGMHSFMVHIWDAETGTPVGGALRGHDGGVRSIAFSPNGKHIALRGHDDCLKSVAFSPDGTHIISGSDDRTVQIWDAETGNPVGEPLRGHNDWVTCVAFSPDCMRIISGSDDGTVQIWDAETGNQMGDPLRGHNAFVRSVALSLDGTRIVSGSADNTIRIWDAETRIPVEKPLEGHRDCVVSVAFSPDGTRVVSGSRDMAVRIWDAETGSSVGEPLRGHSDWVLSVAFLPDKSQHKTELVVVNKSDRAASRPAQVESNLFDLFTTLGATYEQADYPLYASAKQGWAQDILPSPSTNDHPTSNMTMTLLFELIQKHAPPPSHLDRTTPFSMLTVEIESDPYGHAPPRPHRPTISIVVHANDSPLAGQEGNKLTSQLIRNCIYEEAETNVTLTVLPGLIFESLKLHGGITRDAARPAPQPGSKQGSVSVLVKDPEEYAGSVVQKLTMRKGEMVSYEAEEEFKNDVHGQGMINHVLDTNRIEEPLIRAGMGL
ncbi:hypothetical protein K443DRAFT_4064 [Laccaria amethystina LaAM-08-1]|uniref:T6SS Phospholipase effector Tle1-like catalytic domain-containing protein n=1 Tax=Laccaria amethystina LaAM-08-1 TaxID=1095629 RepID=A0A0C9Y4M5_9AGAR|nr:hypothetical protein K443DRAFT_4064 [Laccaria amethystina LaAM-08-1]